MRGKLIEDLKYVQAVPSAQRVTAASLFNGSSTSAISNGIDTRDYDEINFVVNSGTFAATASVELFLYHNEDDDPSAATLVSGVDGNGTSDDGTFTAITTANDAAIQTASVKCKNFKRYMWIVSSQNAYCTNYGVTAVLGKSDSDPYDNSPVFDLQY
jgi:hypothetical protein